MKIVTVVGARPQFIKASVLSLEFSKDQSIQEIIVHTGQHFDHNMSKIFFEEMMIPTPKYNLGVQNLSHGAMTGRQLEKVEEILLKEKPDFVLVYGDTNSTLAGALAAVKIHIPVIHVESGLRSFNRKMPEEINRLITDAIADYLLTPSPDGDENLRNEGVSEDRIKRVGNVMIDSLFNNLERSKNSTIHSDLNIEKGNYGVLTLHRPSNVDEKDARISKMTGSLIRSSGRLQKKADGRRLRIPGMLDLVQGMGLMLETHGISQVSMNLRDVNLTPMHVAFEAVKAVVNDHGVETCGSESVSYTHLTLPTNREV